jgi:hypothetical protein
MAVLWRVLGSCWSFWALLTKHNFLRPGRRTGRTLLLAALLSLLLWGSLAKLTPAQAAPAVEHCHSPRRRAEGAPLHAATEVS